MKILITAGAVVFAALLSSGCATYFHGAAPAQPGSIYVVGGKQSQPQAWVCPSAPKKGECQEITVEEVGE